MRGRRTTTMESFFSIFKKEEFYRSKYRSEKELRNKVEEYILFYNQKRPHTTLNYKTPEQYEDEYFQKLKNSIYGIEGSNFWFFAVSNLILACL